MPHAAIELDDDLMEWDYGDYEGKRHRRYQSGSVPVGAFFATAAPAASHSNPWASVRTASSAEFVQTAAMCSSLVTATA